MTQAQKWAAAADILTSARNKVDGGSGVPADGLITSFRDDITEGCSGDVPGLIITDVTYGVCLPGQPRPVWILASRWPREKSRRFGGERIRIPSLDELANGCSRGFSADLPGISISAGPPGPDRARLGQTPPGHRRQPPPGGAVRLVLLVVGRPLLPAGQTRLLPRRERRTGPRSSTVCSPTRPAGRSRSRRSTTTPPTRALSSRRSGSCGTSSSSPRWCWSATAV